MTLFITLCIDLKGAWHAGVLSMIQKIPNVSLKNCRVSALSAGGLGF